MGKRSVIKSLGRCIGNVALHKLLLAHTNRPESKNYLRSEVLEYGTDAFEKAQIFNWNERDKEEIKRLALERVTRLLENYPDIEPADGEVEKLVTETIEDVMP